MVNRWMVPVSVAALLMAASAPVAAQDEADGSMGEPSGSITVLTLQGAQADALGAIVPEFEARYPGVDVTLNVTGNDDLRNNSARLYASSDAPDVGWMWNDARIYPGLIENDVLEPLDDVWAEMDLDSAYSDTVKGLYTEEDGSRYAVHTDFVWAPVVYYNKELFEAAGIAPPDGRLASLDEWDAVVTALKDAGVAPLAVGVGDGYPAKHIPDQLLVTAATDDEFTDYLNNWRPGSDPSVHYDQPPFLSSLEVLAQWQEDGVFAPGTPAATADQAMALFLAGGAAMMSGGSWHPGILDAQEVPFEYGWFLYPSLGEQPTPFLAYAGNAYVVPKASDDKESAKLFVSFLMDKDVQEQIIPQFGVPARQDIDVASLAVHPMLAEMLAAMPEYGVSTLWGDVVPPALGEAAAPLYAEILTGTKSPEQVGTEFEAIAEGLRSGE